MKIFKAYISQNRGSGLTMYFIHDFEFCSVVIDLKKDTHIPTKLCVTQIVFFGQTVAQMKKMQKTNTHYFFNFMGVSFLFSYKFFMYVCVSLDVNINNSKLEIMLLHYIFRMKLKLSKSLILGKNMAKIKLAKLKNLLSLHCVIAKYCPRETSLEPES